MSDLPTSALWSEVEAPRWQPNRTAWLLTCVDLTSLLVGFFVLLFSTQTIKRDKWDAVTGSFQSQFAVREALGEVVPDGGENAVVRVTVMRSGLAYLDALLHQRLAGDAVWKDLTAEIAQDGTQDMTYLLPETVDDSAWERLGGAVRGWKNPVGVRLTASPEDVTAATQKAIAMAAELAKSGVMSAFAEVRLVPKTKGFLAQLVVRP